LGHRGARILSEPVRNPLGPAKFVDDVLKVVFRSIGITALYGRFVMLVDQEGVVRSSV